ncbi:GNAT family N-acetyltransferase [Paenibacillus sp. NPDC056579]|uniref:GNAT family N-acetyltransferase n=1 Tax=Paenibacillus sp. NPDC056579 TaxID=3345871 RepID=UPI0036C67A23
MNYRFSELAPEPQALFDLYDSVQWNEFLQLSKERLFQAIEQSWYAIHVYDDEKLIGTGRVISDGVINAVLCGIAVHPDYRRQGIGSDIVRGLVSKCRESRLHIQLFCTEDKADYYLHLGFETFAVGMKEQGNVEEAE